MRTKNPRPRSAEPLDPHRARHLSLETRQILTEDGIASVLVNDSESPLAWLARRKGRDGQSLISPSQFIAGEKLRADFTRANMAPRMTADWSAHTGRSRRSGRTPTDITDAMVASRQKLGQALDACGPEFSGLLMDVCCFLRGLEDIERERHWPARSAKVVLQLALDRLARHYGFAGEPNGRPGKLRAWLAEDAVFEV